MVKQWLSTGLAALVVTLFVANFILFSREASNLNELVEAYRQHHEKYIIATRMRQSTNDLTRLARTYVATGDKKFLDQYLEILKIRNGESPEPSNFDRIYWDYLAVEGQSPPSMLTSPISYQEILSKGGLNEHEMELLTQARQKSDELAELEMSIFSQAGKPGNLASERLLYDADYHRRKLAILSRVNEVLKSLDERSRIKVLSIQKAHETENRIQYSIFTALIFACAAWLLHSYRANKLAIDELDRKVADRTLSLVEANQQLETAIAKIKTLEGLLPICAYCHNVRDDDGNWCRIEDYISMRSAARFTHGMCPTCYRREVAKFRSTPTSSA